MILINHQPRNQCLVVLLVIIIVVLTMIPRRCVIPSLRITYLFLFLFLVLHHHRQRPAASRTFRSFCPCATPTKSATSPFRCALVSSSRLPSFHR